MLLAALESAPALSPTRPPTARYYMGGRVGERAGTALRNKDYTLLRKIRAAAQPRPRDRITAEIP